MLVKNIKENIGKSIIGQEELVDNLLICLFAGGHALLEGMPGLAKTKLTKALADSIDTKFKRIQFTPDLLPADITGSDIFIRETSKFEFVEGPLINNIILADEINRAPAKVQSALLEALAEGQVTIGNKTIKLPQLFMVLATQNPIEQEGTYNLPEAQLDRFMMKLEVNYPNSQEELKILQLELGNITSDKADKVGGGKVNITPVASERDILEARNQTASIFVDDKILQYIVSIVMATRKPEAYGEQLSSLISYGASTRASLALLRCSQAAAFIDGSDFVAPYHVQRIAYEVLRHRIIPSFEAEADNVTHNDIIDHIIELVAV